MITAVLFDLGDTLIHERVDDAETLERLPLHAKPGARDVLSRLADRFTLGLVTDTESSNEVIVRRALRNLGLEGFFAAVVTSQDVGVSKPDPQMFDEALRRLGAIAAETVMVGNDLDRDITPAMALGMRAILVSDSSYYDSTKQTVAPVASTLWEVPDLVLAMAERGGSSPGRDPGASEPAASVPSGSDDAEDLRAQYATATGMSIYDGALSWQVTGLYVQFAFLLAAGAVFPSFVGTSNRFLLALAGSLIALAGLVTAAMFGSMCMRIRTYQDLWVSRAEMIEAQMGGPGVMSAGSVLSREKAVVSGATTLRMRQMSAVRTKTMMNVLFLIFIAVFMGLLILNIVRAVAAL